MKNFYDSMDSSLLWPTLKVKMLELPKFWVKLQEIPKISTFSEDEWIAIVFIGINTEQKIVELSLLEDIYSSAVLNKIKK